MINEFCILDYNKNSLKPVQDGMTQLLFAAKGYKRLGQKFSSKQKVLVLYILNSKRVLHSWIPGCN